MNDTEILLMFVLAIVVVNIIFLAIARAYSSTQRKRRSVCTSQATAHVVTTVEEINRSTVISHPVFEYMANGEKVQKKYQYGSQVGGLGRKRREPRYPVDAEVVVMYDPNNPKNILVPDDPTPNGRPKMFIISDIITSAIFVAGLIAWLVLK